MNAPPAPGALFPPRLTEVLADLSCVVFRRKMLPSGEISYPWFSDNVTDIFGLRPEEMTVTAKGALNSLHWADRDAHVAAILRSAVSGAHCIEAFRAVTAEGETRWFRGSSSPERQADGSVLWEGAWIDISPWMRAEYQFQTVMDHAEDCILTLDTRNGIDWVNSAAERLFGWTLDEMLGRCISDMLEEPCATNPGGRLAECPVGDVVHCFPRGTQEVLACRKDGTVFPFEMTVSEVRSDGRLSLIVIGRDITRRKATELLLQESELRLRSIAANLPGVVFQRVLDADGTFAYPYVSEGIEEILGCDPSDIVFDSAILFDTMVDEDRRQLMAALLVSAETLDPVREDVRVQGRDGRIRWLRGQSRPRRRGDLIVWDGLILDVTEEVEERIKAEQAVRESEERFRMAFAAASMGIVVVALDGTIQQCNPAFQRMCGHLGEELRGQSIHRAIPPVHLPAPDELPAAGETFTFAFEPQLADGRPRHWQVTGTLFSASPEAPDPSILFLIEDATERVRAAEERRQLEMALHEGHKLEALGRLAGGVSHELNNMLGPILMGAEMMSRTLDLDDRNKDRLSRIIEAAKHGRDIVRNVLAYCRKEQKTLAPLDVVPVFKQFAELAAATLPPGIRVEAHVGPAKAMVIGDAGQLTQVLLNLVNNARDAMGEDGKLELTLDLLPAGAVESLRSRRGTGSTNPLASLDAQAAHVDIHIADTGCGMDPQIATRVFDPFFTTKPVGQGTGLGLSVVQGIVQGMGGAVAVDSDPGHGTTFRVLVPIVAG